MPVGETGIFRKNILLRSHIKVFAHLLGKVPTSRGLTHMRSMRVGVAKTGVGASTTRYLVGANIVRPRRNMKKLFFYRTFV